MMHSSISRWLLLVSLGVLVSLAVVGPVPAFAGTGGGDMPWDPLLDALVANIGGRTLRNILILAIIGAGIGFYFAHEGTWIRSAFGLVIGFSIAVAAATWGPAFFGVAAAATAPGTSHAAPHWTAWLSLGIQLTTWTTVAVVLGGRLFELVGRWLDGRMVPVPVPGEGK